MISTSSLDTATPSAIFLTRTLAQVSLTQNSLQNRLKSLTLHKAYVAPDLERMFGIYIFYQIFFGRLVSSL